MLINKAEVRSRVRNSHRESKKAAQASADADAAQPTGGHARRRGGGRLCARRRPLQGRPASCYKPWGESAGAQGRQGCRVCGTKSVAAEGPGKQRDTSMKPVVKRPQNRVPPRTKVPTRGTGTTCFGSSMGRRGAREAAPPPLRVLVSHDRHDRLRHLPTRGYIHPSFLSRLLGLFPDAICLPATLRGRRPPGVPTTPPPGGQGPAGHRGAHRPRACAGRAPWAARLEERQDA